MKSTHQIHRQKLLDIARHMPPLAHYPDPTQPFDPAKSEVFQWIAKNPKLLQIVFNKLAERRVIVFDQSTRTWSGIETSKGTNPAAQ